MGLSMDRVDGVNQVRYRVGYECVSDKGYLAKLGKRELYAECIEIAKRVKNANFDSKFYTSQLAKDAGLDKRALLQTRVSFEA
jgi:arabinogalactan endo-1,4-beta-galactosidase